MEVRNSPSLSDSMMDQSCHPEMPHFDKPVQELQVQNGSLISVSLWNCLRMELT